LPIAKNRAIPPSYSPRLSFSKKNLGGGDREEILPLTKGGDIPFFISPIPKGGGRFIRGGGVFLPSHPPSLSPPSLWEGGRLRERVSPLPREDFPSF